MKDYYSILQIKPEATKEEIKVAYRKLAKKYHPDVNGGAQWAEERFKELQEAYSVLSDYFEKAEYDRKYAAYYKRKAGTTPRYSSVGNTPRSQATSPNRSTPPKPSTPPKQASGSKPYDTAQAKKSFEDYVKDNPRKAKAFSHWMNFDRSSKNSIYDGIKSDKKLNFEFANKVAAWFRLLIVLGEVFGITALIVIYLMDGQQQLEQVLGTKLTFNSHASNAEFAYWIDDASGVTHSRKCPKYNVGKGHGSNTATSKRCDCSYCRLETTSAGKNHRERSSFSAREADDNRTQNEAEQATAHETSRATSTFSKVTHSDASSTSSNISSPYSPPIPSISTYPSTNNGAKYSYGSSSMNTSSLRTGAGRYGKAFDSRREHVGREKSQQPQSNKQDGSIASSSGYKTSAVSDYISSYRPHDSSHSDSHSPVSSETSTEAAPQTQTEQTSIPDSERITDSDWECTDGCEREDFWITEEDDTTHNSKCSLYGKGEGMYAVQGSGTDCTVCGGAN